MAVSHLPQVSRARVLRNAAGNYSATLVSLVTWFFLTPFIVHELGDSRFGLWALVGSLVAFGTLLDFGMADVVTKYVSEFRAIGKMREAARLVATALSVYTGIGLLVALVAGGVAPFFPLIFNVEAADAKTAAWLVFLSGLGVGVALPCATGGAALRGLQRFDLHGLLSIGRTLLTALGIVAALLGGTGVLGMAIAGTLSRLLMQVPTVYLIRRTAPDLQFGWRGANRESLRKVVSFSWPIFQIRVGGHLETKTDEIVIGGFLPLSAVAPYAIAHKLSTLPQMITEQFLMLLLPMASELHARREHERLRQLYVDAARLTLAVFLPLALIMSILARPFLTVWMGESYAEHGTLLTVLLLAVMLDTLLWPAGFVLQGMSRHRFPARVCLGAGVANVALSVLLVQPLGLFGVALATLIATAVAATLLVLPYAHRQIGLGLWQALRGVFLPPLLPGLASAGVTAGLRDLLLPASYAGLVLVGGAGCLVYSLLYLWIGAGEMERGALRDVLTRCRQYLRS